MQSDKVGLTLGESVLKLEDGVYGEEALAVFVEVLEELVGLVDEAGGLRQVELAGSRLNAYTGLSYACSH